MSPKFLSGGQYSGSQVPLCTFWHTDVITDTDEDFASLVSQDHAGQCIANAYFKREDISCFNDGDCNGEGKCLPCSKYKYGGMRVAISHSPPLEVLRQFNKGLTEAEIQSPNLAQFPVEAIEQVDQDQLPFHALLKNIMAEIAKCCHWEAGDGDPSRFFLTPIIKGSETLTVVDENGKSTTFTGIRIQNSAFPDEVGSFFPVGTQVVAGFEGQPSFYLEPRTGLVKDGIDVIFNFNDLNTSVNQAKREASASSVYVAETADAVSAAKDATLTELNRVTDFFNTALATNEINTIIAATSKFVTASANFASATTANTTAQTQKTQADNLISIIGAATDKDTVETNAKLLAVVLNAMAISAETAAAAAAGTSEADLALIQSRRLKISARSLRFSGFGGFSKCEFFFEEGNGAQNWNAPDDGTIPCNGIRTDCDFYTGKQWNFATDEKLEIGQSVNAEQIQEIRFRSEDWTRFINPEAEFESRFSVPFIWAFKGYFDVSGEPDIEDMILYRPKVLFGRDTPDSDFDTIQMEKVSIIDFDDFTVGKNTALIKPGTQVINKQLPPEFPSVVSKFDVPVSIRLKITHPRVTTTPEPESGIPVVNAFVYRMWSSDKNKITILGTATADSEIFLVNETALKRRSSYHTLFDTINHMPDLPTGLPGSPSFTTVTATELRNVFDKLTLEKRSNTSPAPLGFARVVSDGEGFWSSIADVDLVHNNINIIYAFLIVDETTILVESTLVDCRFLHSVITQTGFEGKDFSINDTLGFSNLGISAGDTVAKAIITAAPVQTFGVNREIVGFNQGYYGWRVKNRNLRFGNILNASDLQGGQVITDSASAFVVDSDASNFIVNVTYQVVRYRKTITLREWFTVNECGLIMAIIDDLNAHRVLPLPNTGGTVKPLPNILVNGGGTGSEIAQWGIESARLISKSGDAPPKNLIQFIRDTDGFGLPANYVILGPDINEEIAFGRPDPELQDIEITFTFLRPQTVNPEDPNALDLATAELQSEDDGVEILDLNFYGDNLRTFEHTIAFDDEGSLTAGGERTFDTEASTEEEAPVVASPITREQQDYVWVFQDSDGRPIGRKYSRMMLMYYSIAAVNTEIFYRWTGTCTTYALLPDFNLIIGDRDGTLTQSLKATTDVNDLTLSNRISQSVLGDNDCINTPSCGDHEFLTLSKNRIEFEVVVFGDPDEEGQVPFPGGKAFYPSAGQAVPLGANTTFTPQSPFLIRRGPMWYPYNICERSRYSMRTGGPPGTDSTELINEELEAPGLTFFSNDVSAQAGTFGNLIAAEQEAYRGPDRAVARILDIHPSLRRCASGYTYGNQILTGETFQFTGYARKRGEVDPFWYQGLGWALPPFGNFGRNRLVFEVTEKFGDYLTTNETIGFRWMPMFPEREDLGSTIRLFSEDLEPQHYRLLSIDSPAGVLSEQVVIGDDLPRFQHKQLITNRTAAAIDYPFSPYFPSFLPDVDIGKNPNQQTEDVSEGAQLSTISTMWAWREQEPLIGRGVNNTAVILGIDFTAPDYFLDNRRLEVRLRPSEGNFNVTFTPPIFNTDGSVATNAFLALGTGPPREILIDFANKSFGALLNGIYDTSQQIDADENIGLPCTPNTPTDNPKLANKCSCILDVDDQTLKDATPILLPARFQHLDELATDTGQFALYESETMQAPFAVDIERETADDPCCQCIYYIPGIFAKIDLETLPVATNIDPSFDGRIDVKYTWSRVPHGYPTNTTVGEDGVFATNEFRADSYVSDVLGEVFIKRFITGTQIIDPAVGDVSAMFPSPSLATLATDQDIPYSVIPPLPSGDPKLKGGASATGGTSKGQPEKIILDIVFDTFVQITKVTVGFITGIDENVFNNLGLRAVYQVPLFRLGIIDTADRTGVATLRTSRIVGESIRTAKGLNVPGNFNRDQTTIISNGKFLFKEEIRPTYADTPFWNRFGQEFHLIFDSRDQDGSMGISFIKLEVSSFSSTGPFTETITIPDRRYYTASATPTRGNNPEQFLGELDSATAYWRTTENGGIGGGNRFRAYAWDVKLEDNQLPEQGNIEDLELLQEEEYNKAKELLPSPHTYTYKSFFPLDEQDFLDFFNEETPTWSLNMSMEISTIDGVKASNGQSVYGIIPERERFSAPGHVWTYNFTSSFGFCCDPCPSQMTVDFQFAHLHDGLAIVEAALFWDELPTGFNKLFRSTMILPDPRFQGQDPSGNTVIFEEGDFLDANGNPIPAENIDGASVISLEDGTKILVDKGQ